MRAEAAGGRSYSMAVSVAAPEYKKAGAIVMYLERALFQSLNIYGGRLTVTCEKP